MKWRQDVIFIYATRASSRLQLKGCWYYLLGFIAFQLEAYHRGCSNSDLGLGNHILSSNGQIVFSTTIVNCAQLRSLSTSVSATPDLSVQHV